VRNISAFFSLIKSSKIKKALWLFVLIAMVFSTLSICAFAVWDGSGSGGGTGGTTTITSGFALDYAGISDAMGYRFTIYDETGTKKGHSVDIDFEGHTNSLYAEFAKQGLDEAQADASMKATYGMDVKAYSKKLAEETDFDKLTSSLVEGGVYYVSNFKNSSPAAYNLGELHFGSNFTHGIMPKYIFQIRNGTQLSITQFPFYVPRYPYRYPSSITLTKS